MNQVEVDVNDYFRRKNIRFLGFPTEQPWSHQMPDGKVRLGPPSLGLYRVVLVIPARSVPGRAALTGGAYSAAQEPIWHTAVVRGPTESVYEIAPGQGGLFAAAPRLPGTVLLSGWNRHQRGHLLTETVASTWASRLFAPDITRAFFDPWHRTFSDSECEVLLDLGVRSRGQSGSSL